MSHLWSKCIASIRELLMATPADGGAEILLRTPKDRPRCLVRWWEERKIDPLKVAEQLWSQTSAKARLVKIDQVSPYGSCDGTSSQS